MSKGILYYSPNCKMCVNLMNKHNLTNFEKVDIGKQKFPNYVKNVPTLIVDNNMYVGNNADLYLQDNALIDSYDLNTIQNTGGFSFLDDDSCKYSVQNNYSEL